MRAIRGIAGAILALAAVGLSFFLWNKSTPERKSPASPDGMRFRQPTNRPTLGPGGVFMARRTQLDAIQLAAVKEAFEERLKPAIQAWCKAYSGRVPFGPEDVTVDCLHGQVGRGTFNLYTFMVNGVTLAVEDADSTADVSYLNAPASKKLMELPRGTPPDPSIPVTREELAEMLHLDSGRDFPQAEIRVIPTAFSSAMNGGAHVNVGGDPVNAASWKFTLVFGPDGKLNYYCKGSQ